MARFAVWLLACAAAPLLAQNAPGAEQNFQFVLNVVHWLTGTL